MSVGRHSISTSRSTCSRMPPWAFTPTGTPINWIGTETRIALSIAMRLRSMCSRAPLMRLMLPVDDHRLHHCGPVTSRSKMVLWPESECRILVMTRGSTETATES